MVSKHNTEHATGSVGSPAQTVVEMEHDYAALRQQIQLTWQAALTLGPVFTTNVDREVLWSAYLDNLPSQWRQHYNCHCCRRFIQAYGGLVAVNPTGKTIAAMWDAKSVAVPYQSAMLAMQTAVERARITGMWLASEPTWGTPTSPREGWSEEPWTHFAVEQPPARCFRHPAISPFQAMAVIKENYRTVVTSLQCFPPALLDTALQLLKAETLDRAERFIGPAQWLRDLHNRSMQTNNNRYQENLLWRAVAVAPDGFCHPRTSMVGNLLEDLESGAPLADVKQRFNLKVRDDNFQRSKAAPTEGNIQQAEKLFDRMGLQTALQRRYLRFEEIPEFVWRPVAPLVAEKRGVFGHLKTKGSIEVERHSLHIPKVTLTWAKFHRKVLPEAEAISFLVPSGKRGFVALTTAVDPEAAPILKWDHDTVRNPVAWYCYTAGSTAQQWHLIPGRTVAVTGITALPNIWGDTPRPELGEGVILLLQGARDQPDCGHPGLFSENLRSELHPVRATIEAFCLTAHPEGTEEATACGYDIRAGQNGGRLIDVHLLVAANSRWTEYRLDRWD